MSASTANPSCNFSAADADVVLQSKDGAVFRIHSIVLRTTSGFFRTLLTLPQPKASPVPDDTIQVDEDTQTLEVLLRMITGTEVLPANFDSFESIEAVLRAAEKYDMPGPISIIRLIILSPTFIVDPLHVYLLACRYGWQDVATTAVTLTLKIDVQDPDPKIRGVLSRLDSVDLMRLLQLHWARRYKFREGIDSKEVFGSGNAEYNPSCGHLNTDSTWPKLKLALLREIERCPAGDAILGPEFELWPEWKAVTLAKCSRCSQPWHSYQTLHSIRSLVSSLPKSI